MKLLISKGALFLTCVSMKACESKLFRTMYLEVVVLLDSYPKTLEVLGCELARAKVFILFVHPKFDVVRGVDQPVSFEHFSKPLRLVLLPLLGRAERESVVLVCLTAQDKDFL